MERSDYINKLLKFKILSEEDILNLKKKYPTMKTVEDVLNEHEVNFLVLDRDLIWCEVIEKFPIDNMTEKEWVRTMMLESKGKFNPSLLREHYLNSKKIKTK